jgi:hypothetical protein
MKLLSADHNGVELEIGQFFPPVEYLDEGKGLFREPSTFRRKDHSR